MAMNEFVPMSWNGEPISTDKLNQMCNNTQYLFDRSPRIRYAVAGLTRDTGLKVISGKTSYGITGWDFEDVYVYFGSFFSAGCKPAVTASVEHTGGGARRLCTIRGLNGEIDHTGFIGHISVQEVTYWTLTTPGWIHWTAVGY